jgi:hypothetical protein
LEKATRDQQLWGFQAGAASAPILTFWITGALISAGPHVPATFHPPLVQAIGGVLVGAVAFGVFAAAVGIWGAMLLMAPAWFILLRLTPAHRSPDAWAYSLAGAAAGLAHVAIAAMAAHGLLNPGVSALLGTWLLGAAFAKGEFLPMLAPPLAGALSGLLCWRVVRGPRARPAAHPGERSEAAP